MLSVRLFIKFDFPKFHNILKNRSIHLYFNLFYLTIVKNRTYCISSVHSLSRVRLFATPWITARQAFLSITNSRSALRLTSIESVMPSSHLGLCRPLLLLPPIPPSIRVFSNVSTLRMRWPKYWSFSFIIIANLHSLKKPIYKLDGTEAVCGIFPYCFALAPLGKVRHS